MNIQLEEPDSASKAEWVCINSTNASDTQKPVVPDETASGAEGLKTIFSDIQSLIGEPESVEEKPSEYAIERVYGLLPQIAYEMMKKQIETGDETWDFPSGYTTSDGCNGIRIEWWHERTHCIHLIVGKDQKSKEYVFQKLKVEERGKLNQKLDPWNIASQLHQLNQIKQS